MLKKSNSDCQSCDSDDDEHFPNSFFDGDDEYQDGSDPVFEG
jgi:hypothetical protein